MQIRGNSPWGFFLCCQTGPPVQSMWLFSWLRVALPKAAHYRLNISSSDPTHLCPQLAGFEFRYQFPAHGGPA
ncbi:hypothetical protein BB8028_0001g15660 [Beauveria bassiana]|uniref:Uncharacterized protein n=1 Tax=Beauveria bassiana TaxID=176275 RepID=A0A2S7Y022_BEABA|nr:hypothetical protein BB8028_0001g15660 [Beauveria bassiana]